MDSKLVKNKADNSRKNIVFSVIIILFIAVCMFMMVIQGFSAQPLWLDESMLMNSVLTRDFTALCSSPLDFTQNAPVGYLYIVKTLTLLMGSGENVLRLFSVLATVGAVALTYLISRSMYSVKYSLLTTAFVSSLGIIVRYGAEAKPYASDMFFVLLCIWLYALYKQKKINYITIVLSYAAAIWFSFAALFFVAGIMILEFVLLVISYRNKEIKLKDITQKTVLAMMVVLSALLCYFIWLKPSMEHMKVYDDYFANDYWKHLSFPLIPKSISDIKLGFEMLQRIIAHLGAFKIVIVIGAVLGVVTAVKKRIYILLGMYFSLTLMLMVSYIGSFPIENRLLLFVLPIFVMSAFAFFSSAHSRLEKYPVSALLKRIIKITAVVLLITALLINLESLLFTHQQKMIKRYGAVDDTHMEYLDDHMTEDDKVYVFFYNIPSYFYATDYEIYNQHFYYEPKAYDDVIIGSFFAASNIDTPYEYNWEIDSKIMNLDVDMVSQNNSVYILIPVSQVNEADVIEAFLSALELRGSLKYVYRSNSTDIYHYAR